MPMTARARVEAQIGHEETDFIPFAKLAFEGDVAERLDASFGGAGWRRTVGALNHIHDISDEAPLREWREPSPGEAGTSGLRTDLFGSVWRTDIRPPRLVRPILREPSLTGFRLPRADEFFPPGWSDRAMQAIERWPGHFLVAGAGAGFFERAWVVRGFEEALADSAAEPAFYERLLDDLAELESGILLRLLELPVQGILFADDWADQRGILLGRERWQRLVLRRQAALYETVRRSGKRVLSHCCGNVREIVPDLVDAGLEVLQSIQPEAMDPYVLKREFGGSLCLWGGLGSQRTIPFGTPGEIRGEIRRLCTEMGRGGGYILGTAKSLQPETPTENAAAVVEGFFAEAGVTVGRRHAGPAGS
jgi:uroporphyrinogen decarboxylase